MIATSRFPMWDELVREHSLDLRLAQPVPEPLGDGDDGVLRVPPGRERVRHVGRDDGDPRLRQVGHRAQALDHVVELRRLVAVDHLRARPPLSAILSDV